MSAELAVTVALVRRIEAKTIRIIRLENALSEWLKLAEHQDLSTASHRSRTRVLLSEGQCDDLSV